MLRTLFFLALSILLNCYSVVLAQRTTPARRSNSNISQKPTNALKRWDRKLYATINHTNFRREALFLQKPDFNNLDFGLIHAAIFFATNEYRVQSQLKPLDYAPELEIMAYHHAKAMAEQDFFSHKNPKTASRATTTDRGKLAGITNPSIAENIAMQYGYTHNSYLSLADSMLEQWINSQGHKENILSTKALALGCGFMFKGEKLYGVQCFQWFRAIIPSKQSVDKLPD